jgi:hypothetical protein
MAYINTEYNENIFRLDEELDNELLIEKEIESLNIYVKCCLCGKNIGINSENNIENNIYICIGDGRYTDGKRRLIFIHTECKKKIL